MSIYIDVLDHHETIHDRAKATATIFRFEGYGGAVTRVRLDSHYCHEPRDARNQEQIYETRRSATEEFNDKILDCSSSDHAVHLRHYGRTHDRFQNCLHVTVPLLCHHIPGIVRNRQTIHLKSVGEMYYIAKIFEYSHEPFFQISWIAWRKMMYVFWLAVIGYSIIMLILVYTYQFKNFPTYWDYLGINKNL